MLRGLLLRYVLPLFAALTMLSAASPAFAATDLIGPACKNGGHDTAFCSTGKTTNDPLSSKNGIIHKATFIIATIAGIAAVIILIWAGIQYISSGGDAEQVSKAKRTIIFALIGILVIITAQGIINFVLKGV